MAEKLGAKKLTPQASVQKLNLAVGDFESPARRLEASLNEFAQNVAGTAVRKHNEHAKSQEEKGRAAAAEAIAAGHTTLEEMTKEGIIDRGSNPFFRDGVLFMAGKARADAFNNAVTIAAAEEIPEDSTDPNAMDAIIERVSGEFTTADDDESTRAGFAERAEQFATTQMSRHAQRVADNLVSKHLDQASDLFRGVVLQATDGVDPEFHVPNVVMAVQAQAEEYLGAIPDPSAHDKRTMNRAITASIAGLIEDGVLGEDAAISAMKLLKGGTGNLWGSQEHSAVIQDAIDTQVNRVTRRQKFEDDRILREKQTNEDKATAAMFAAAGETGILDIQPMIDMQRESKGKAFRLGYIDAQRQLSLVYEHAAQDTYVGSEVIERDYGARIFAGEPVSREELAHSLETKDLTLDQVVRLGNMLTTHQNMLANNPAKSARFRRMDAATKGGMTSWMGSEYGSQAYYASLPAMAAALEGWEADPKNANFTAESKEFLDFTNETMKNLQSRFMETDQWQELQDEQDRIQGVNMLERYKSTVYESRPETLRNWYAEALMLSEGRAPSASFSEFVDAPGRSLGADAPLEDYADAIFGQMQQSGVAVPQGDELESMMNELRGAVVTDEDDEDSGESAAPAEDEPEERGAFFTPSADGGVPGGLEVAQRLFGGFLEGIQSSDEPTGTGPEGDLRIRGGLQVFRDALVKRGWVPPSMKPTEPPLPRQKIHNANAPNLGPAPEVVVKPKLKTGIDLASLDRNDPGAED